MALRVGFHVGEEALAFVVFTAVLAEEVLRLHHGGEVQPTGQRAAGGQRFRLAGEQDEHELRGFGR